VDPKKQKKQNQKTETGAPRQGGDIFPAHDRECGKLLNFPRPSGVGVLVECGFYGGVRKKRDGEEFSGGKDLNLQGDIPPRRGAKKSSGKGVCLVLSCWGCGSYGFSLGGACLLKIQKNIKCGKKVVGWVQGELAGVF